MSSKWRWAASRDKRAFLALEDGTVARGYSVGAPRNSLGEVVFNTGITGYQEILTDPSYSGQIVTMTYPEIGNTGINCDDMESRQLFANGFVIHDMNEPSNWRATESLSDCLKRHGIPAIAGVDTRALTIKLRESGTLKGYLVVPGEDEDGLDGTADNGGTGAPKPDASAVSEEDAVGIAKDWPGLDGQDYAAKVTCDKTYPWDVDGKLTRSWGVADELPPADLKIVAYDFGIKWNILRSMRRCGMDVTIVPANTSAKEALAIKPDGVFFSNGPADPSAVTYAIDAARSLVGKVPFMGICLGHQILGLALGGRTYRLKFGHHGCNHPVKNLATTQVEITSQNHNFAVDSKSLDASIVEITHINLNDGTVEGISHKREPAFSVQYHPEAGPGPHDPFYLFARFKELILNA